MERKVLEATNPVFSFIRGKIEFMEVISPSLKELDIKEIIVLVTSL